MKDEGYPYELSDKEKQRVEEFTTTADPSSLLSLSPSQSTSSTALRFLGARKFSVGQALELLHTYQSVLGKEGISMPINPHVDADVKQELLSGKFVVLNDDDVTGARVGQFFVKQCLGPTNSRALLESIILQLDAVVQKEVAARNGLIFLYDMTDAKFANVDCAFAMKLFKFLQTAYPIRMRRIVILTAPLWFRASLRLFRTLVRDNNDIHVIRPVTGSKLEALTRPDPVEMRQLLAGWIDTVLERNSLSPFASSTIMHQHGNGKIPASYASPSPPRRPPPPCLPINSRTSSDDCSTIDSIAFADAAPGVTDGDEIVQSPHLVDEQAPELRHKDATNDNDDDHQDVALSDDNEIVSLADLDDAFFCYSSSLSSSLITTNTSNELDPMDCVDATCSDAGWEAGDGGTNWSSHPILSLNVLSGRLAAPSTSTDQPLLTTSSCSPSSPLSLILPIDGGEIVGTSYTSSAATCPMPHRRSKNSNTKSPDSGGKDRGDPDEEDAGTPTPPQSSSSKRLNLLPSTCGSRGGLDGASKHHHLLPSRHSSSPDQLIVPSYGQQLQASPSGHLSAPVGGSAVKVTRLPSIKSTGGILPNHHQAPPPSRTAPLAVDEIGTGSINSSSIVAREPDLPSSVSFVKTADNVDSSCTSSALFDNSDLLNLELGESTEPEEVVQCMAPTVFSSGRRPLGLSIHQGPEVNDAQSVGCRIDDLNNEEEEDMDYDDSDDEYDEDDLSSSNPSSSVSSASSSSSSIPSSHEDRPKSSTSDHWRTIEQLIEHVKEVGVAGLEDEYRTVAKIKTPDPRTAFKMPPKASCLVELTYSSLTHEDYTQIHSDWTVQDHGHHYRHYRNREKNRYVDVICYDHSRVHLLRPAANGDESHRPGPVQSRKSSSLHRTRSDPYGRKSRPLNAIDRRRERLAGSRKKKDQQQPARRNRRRRNLARNYIHANWVDGYRQKNAFICTQGPLAETVTDFWQMIWDYRIPVIVMVTKVREAGRPKCFPYWPTQESQKINFGTGSSNQYGDSAFHQLPPLDHSDDEDDGSSSRSPVADFQVECLAGTINHEEHFIQSRLKLTNLATGSVHNLTHIACFSWPDHGLPPTTTGLLHLLKAAQLAYSESLTGFSLPYREPEQFDPMVLQPPPILVHCSAGIGRTGTYVTVDTCSKRLVDSSQTDKRINIPLTVGRLRSQRYGCVQVPSQYVFCYQALLEFAVEVELVRRDLAQPAIELLAEGLRSNSIGRRPFLLPSHFMNSVGGSSASPLMMTSHVIDPRSQMAVGCHRTQSSVASRAGSSQPWWRDFIGSRFTSFWNSVRSNSSNSSSKHQLQQPIQVSDDAPSSSAVVTDNAAALPPDSAFDMVENGSSDHSSSDSDDRMMFDDRDMAPMMITKPVLQTASSIELVGDPADIMLDVQDNNGQSINGSSFDCNHDQQEYDADQQSNTSVSNYGNDVHQHQEDVVQTMEEEEEDTLSTAC